MTTDILKQIAVMTSGIPEDITVRSRRKKTMIFLLLHDLAAAKMIWRELLKMEIIAYVDLFITEEECLNNVRLQPSILISDEFHYNRIIKHFKKFPRVPEIIVLTSKHDRTSPEELRKKNAHTVAKDEGMLKKTLDAIRYILLKKKLGIENRYN